MRMRFSNTSALWTGLAVLVVSTSGCATKKYVTQTVTPVEQRTATLEKTSTEHGEAIANLEKGVSQADERAMTADKKAQDAAAAASKASGEAQQAQMEASKASAVAKEGLNKANSNDRALAAQRAALENAGNYTVVSTQTVLFNLNSSELTKEGQAQLDSVIQKYNSAENCAIQLEGFTDTSGTVPFNLQLSRRRAESVARYLAVNGHIPPYKIHMMGLGEEMPSATNDTRQGREENRRVQVSVLQPSMMGNAASASAGMDPR